MDFYRIPIEFQNDPEKRIFRSIHAGSKASKEIVSRFYNDKMTKKENHAFEILKRTYNHKDLLSEL